MEEINKQIEEDKKHQQNANKVINLINNIKEVITIDGLRIIFEDGFALIRQSNTEPVFTLRFEEKTKEKCEHYKNTLVDLTSTLVEDLISQKV